VWHFVCVYPLHCKAVYEMSRAQCKPPHKTQWDVWGLIPKDAPRFREIFGECWAKGKSDHDYNNYVTAVAALAVEDKVDTLIITPGKGELPLAVCVTYAPVKDTLHFKKAKPYVSMVLYLKYARPCWGGDDCCCGKVYTLDCNITALRFQGKVYALCMAGVKPSRMKPTGQTNVVTQIPEEYKKCFAPEVLETLGISNNN